VNYSFKVKKPQSMVKRIDERKKSCMITRGRYRSKLNISREKQLRERD